MLKNKKYPYTRKVLWLSLIFAVIIYVLGIISGIFANNVFENKFSGDIDQIKNMIDESSVDIKSLQLQDFYLNHFEEGEACSLIDIYINDMYNRINQYWRILPKRLEEYESTHMVNEEYRSLKREYIRLSLRMWLITRNNYERCNNKEITPILYFYTNNCSDCVDQGKIFDDFKKSMSEQNRSVLIFPVDFNFDDDTVYMLKRHYNISTVPSIIVNGMILEGVTPADDIKEAIDKKRVDYGFIIKS